MDALILADHVSATVDHSMAQTVNDQQCDPCPCPCLRVRGSCVYVSLCGCVGVHLQLMPIFCHLQQFIRHPLGRPLCRSLFCHPLPDKSEFKEWSDQVSIPPIGSGPWLWILHTSLILYTFYYCPTLFGMQTSSHGWRLIPQNTDHSGFLLLPPRLSAT